MEFLKIYYEIFLTDAEKINAKTIQTVGGDYAEYEKCEFCGEWCDVEELNSESYCTRCQVAIRDHGFTTPHDKKYSRY